MKYDKATMDAAVNAMMNNLEFFQHDIISGKANKIGDRFTAQFFEDVKTFEVVELNGEQFFAKKID